MKAVVSQNVVKTFKLVSVFSNVFLSFSKFTKKYSFLYCYYAGNILLHN